MSAQPPKPVRVVVHDTAERGWPFLGVWWTIGASVLARPAVRIGARSWEEAYARIESAVRRHPGLAIDLQCWGHGYQGSPLIDGEPVYLPSLARALAAAPRAGSTVWFRSCDVAEGERGHKFMRNAVATLQVPVLAHCAVISLPLPWRQRELCGLRPPKPGEPPAEPWWSLTGAELPSCATLRMTPPAWAFEPPRAA